MIGIVKQDGGIVPGWISEAAVKDCGRSPVCQDDGAFLILPAGYMAVLYGGAYRVVLVTGKLPVLDEHVGTL